MERRTFRQDLNRVNIKRYFAIYDWNERRTSSNALHHRGEYAHGEEMSAWATTYVDVTIRNPAEPQRSWTGKFMVDTQMTAEAANSVTRQRSWTGKLMVDTGAFDSLVPGGTLEAIGLEPKGSRDYVLADGKSVTLEATVAEIEFEGVIVGRTIAYGPEGTEPLLGVTALGSGGIEVDPRGECLKRLPGVLLK